MYKIKQSSEEALKKKLFLPKEKKKQTNPFAYGL